MSFVLLGLDLLGTHPPFLPFLPLDGTSIPSLYLEAHDSSGLIGPAGGNTASGRMAPGVSPAPDLMRL